MSLDDEDREFLMKDLLTSPSVLQSSIICRALKRMGFSIGESAVRNYRKSLTEENESGS